MDDIIVCSRSDREKVFLKCKKYGISLNPRKSNFMFEEGKFLGNIISKDGIKIDPERIKEILKNEQSRSKKEVQSFIGHVNFLRRFIPNFAEILMNITNMLKKYHEIKWIVDTRKDFIDIKQAITEATILVTPYFSKYFLIFFMLLITLLLECCYRKMIKMLSIL